ncbi:MAG: GumC family protein [Syntrophorhabdales bacterium]|jgi:uncharacterized protein involved in exopolysaccharide biosynthesis
MIDERQDIGTQAGTLRDFLAILFKHKTKILVVFFSVVITVTVGSFLLSPTYEAKSSVLVKFGRENLYRPEVGDKGAIISVGQPNQEEILNSEIEILTNRDLMDKVITTIGVEKLYPDLIGKTYRNGVTPKDVAIIQFGKKLSVEAVKKSNVINVSFQHKDPHLAAQVVNLLLDSFKEKHLQVYSDPKSSFLEEQLGEYSQKLKTSEDTLQTFKQTQGVYSLDEQRNLLLKQRMELDTAYKGTQNSIQELQEKSRSLKAQTRMIAEDGNTFAFSEQGNILTSAKSKLLDLQLKEHELLIKYKEDSPPVKDVRKEIQMTKEFLAAQEKDVNSKVRTGNLVYQDVEKERIKAEADLRAQEAKLASLGPQIARVDSELKNLDRQEKQFQDLKRETATNERNYQTYQEKWEDARISDDMNKKKMANISIIQAAAVPTEPVKPKKLLNIALSIVLGAVSALGAAFFSEYLGHTYNTAQDVERRLGLPVLTSVTGSRS